MKPLYDVTYRLYTSIWICWPNRGNIHHFDTGYSCIRRSPFRKELLDILQKRKHFFSNEQVKFVVIMAQLNQYCRKEQVVDRFSHSMPHKNRIITIVEKPVFRGTQCVTTKQSVTDGRTNYRQSDP